MSTLKTLPTLSEVYGVAAAAIPIYAAGVGTLIVVYRVGSLLWLATFAYAAVRNRIHIRKETR